MRSIPCTNTESVLKLLFLFRWNCDLSIATGRGFAVELLFFESPINPAFSEEMGFQKVIRNEILFFLV